MTAIFLSAGTDTRITSKAVLASAAGGSGTTSGGAASGGNSDRRGGSNAPRGFQLLHEVGGFNDRQLAQLFYDCC